MVVSSIKSTSPCCDDHAALHAVEQSDSPQKLELLEAGSRGDHDGGGIVIFSVLCIVCVLVSTMYLTILRHWSLGLSTVKSA
jgi:hypothetical protein